MNQEDRKRIPYGISDYTVIRRENFYYVDKTPYLKEIEKAGEYHFFIRPRRFGKSLFLSMMKCYYDVAYKDQFEELFKGTWIFDNPTRHRGKYPVLFLNFSEVTPAVDLIEESFLAMLRDRVRAFIRRYRSFFSKAEAFDEYYRYTAESSSPADLLGHLNRLVGEARQKMVVIIDEYDNFANTVLAHAGDDAYRKLTHGDGFLRAFFNVLKAGTGDTESPIARLFITGVSPVTMDDVTSGFNIGRNISLRGSLNRMLGFTAEDVAQMLQYYNGVDGVTLDVDSLMPVIADWYGNYRFSADDDVTLFNSDMVLYFIDNYLDRGALPDELIDHNVRIDYGKLRHLIILDQGENKLPATNGNFSKLKQIIETGGISAKISQGFSLEKMADGDNFKSLLFYFGLLTISGYRGGLQYLQIPNETIRRLYFNYISEGYRETGVFSLDLSTYVILMSDMGFKGAWAPLFEFITRLMTESLALRDLIAGEKAVQSFLYTYLSLSDLFIVHAEKELNKGYADLVMEAFVAKYPDIGYSFLIELKYLKTGVKADDPAVTQAAALGREQLKSYSHDPKFNKSIGKTKLVKLLLVFSGPEALLIEEVG